MNKNVKCPDCHGKPRFCDRCAHLISFTERWRKVAEIEHVKHCTKRGDHSLHIEAIFLGLADDGY